MKSDEIIRILDKLIGNVYPTGDFNVDENVKNNLNNMIDVFDHLLYTLCGVANQRDSYYGSVSDIGWIAYTYLCALQNNDNEEV